MQILKHLFSNYLEALGILKFKINNMQYFITAEVNLSDLEEVMISSLMKIVTPLALERAFSVENQKNPNTLISFHHA
jgi:hypothetical protein